MDFDLDQPTGQLCGSTLSSAMTTALAVSPCHGWLGPVQCVARLRWLAFERFVISITSQSPVRQYTSLSHDADPPLSWLGLAQGFSPSFPLRWPAFRGS